MNVTQLVLWLIAALIFAVVELATVQLTAVWLAVGAVAGMAASSLGAPLWVQFTVFAVVSAVLLVLTRPFVRRFLRMKEVHTNADRLIGRAAKVTENIDNSVPSGAVVYSGVTWTARSENGDRIAAGEEVEVRKIEGSKLIVSRIPAPNEAVKK